jgi:transposase
MSGATPSYDELLALTRQQARLIRDLEAKLTRLQAETDRLKAVLEEARRAGKRQAAPFSKGPPKDRPKRPGRKPGHPPAHRAAPPPERVGRTVEVALPEGGPGCRAPLEDMPVAVHDQYQIDLPEPEPVVTRFRVSVTRCPLCRRRVQGRHPEQTSDALGAAAVQLGPRLLAFAADLKHRLGVPYRKAAQAIGTLCGVAVAPSALVRSGHRLRRLARPSYERLIEAARRSPVQHADETGWKIGGHPAWLWDFADRHATLYRVRTSRGHEEVVEALGEAYPGILVSDCLLAYDPLNFRKSMCAAHLLKQCSEIEQSKSWGAVRFSRRMAALLRRATALKRRHGTIGDHGSAVLRGKVHAELDRLLAGTYTDQDNARLARRLRKHRESVLRSLDRDGVDATNNLAEREGRPAVIARKLWAGNRAEARAEAHAVLARVSRTYRRQGRDILHAVITLLCYGPGHVLEFDHTTSAIPAP